MEKVKYKIHLKEKLYFSIRLIISLIVYALIIFIVETFISSPTGLNEYLIIILFYTGIILFSLILRMGLLVGYIKGNGIKLTRNQFPQVYEIIQKQCEQLSLKNIPSVYILQSGGVLNAFATKFIGKNYVVLYSDIFELAYEQGQEALEFVIGHEMGHIKRNHITKSLFLTPSIIIPFLRPAYSRACEYTCDNIGKGIKPRWSKRRITYFSCGQELIQKG